jgi:hypothetical protein
MGNSVCFAFLIDLAWTVLREGHPVWGGLMIAVKFLAWPLVVFLALR